MLLDEPTTFLDLRHQAELYGMLGSLVSERSLAVLVVAHDLNAVSRHCRRMVMLSGGRIVRDGAPAEVMTAEAIGEVFGMRARIEVLSDGTRVVLQEANGEANDR
jgi:iron complex transport system ATP-binding protein